MTEQEWEQTLFQLILHAGNSRSSAKEAAEFAQEGDWENATAKMEEAEEEQLKAHKVNADVIRREAAGEKVEFSVLLAHALDLLVLAWSEIDYTYQYLDMSKRLGALEEEVAQWRSQASKS